MDYKVSEVNIYKSNFDGDYDDKAGASLTFIPFSRINDASRVHNIRVKPLCK